MVWDSGFGTRSEVWGYGVRGKGLGFGVLVSRFQPTVADEYLQRLPILFPNSCESYLFQKQTHTSVRFRSKQKTGMRETG